MSSAPAPVRLQSSNCRPQNAKKAPQPDQPMMGPLKGSPAGTPAREAKTHPARSQGRVQIPPQQEAFTSVSDPGEPPQPKSSQPARALQAVWKPGPIRSRQISRHQGGEAPLRISRRGCMPLGR
ncbi:hypothetical protein NDU88_002539 [Pleurodeles waltl]|uniref:Uncharacterized protein n=1 Tax=Pleurodeles waltl TaxID=8319 RepID=A0AAV7T3K3_PLEWA|nr:hypothetical protein NDU88_002539 [Pleurodeles waltl]